MKIKFLTATLGIASLFSIFKFCKFTFLGQVQTNVHTLVILYVHGHRFRQTQSAAVGGFYAFEVSPDDVVDFAGGHPLGELPGMIGVTLPLGFLIRLAADFYGDAVDGTIVRTPDG